MTRAARDVVAQKVSRTLLLPRRTDERTNAGQTLLVACALRVAVATGLFAGVEVNACVQAGTEVRPRSAIVHALTALACLPEGAGVARRTAMGPVGRDVHADPVEIAVRRAGWARDGLADPAAALLHSRLTLISAAAAIEGVACKVHTLVLSARLADGLTQGAVQDTHTVGTLLAAHARVPAATAVERVRARVDAEAAASGFLGTARGLTATLRTDLRRSAGVVAHATVVRVGTEFDARAVTVDRSRGAVVHAVAGSTQFTLRARQAIRSAMVGIGPDVLARRVVVALGRPFGTTASTNSAGPRTAASGVASGAAGSRTAVATSVSASSSASVLGVSTLAGCTGSRVATVFGARRTTAVEAEPFSFARREILADAATQHQQKCEGDCDATVPLNNGHWPILSDLWL